MFSALLMRRSETIRQIFAGEDIFPGYFTRKDEVHVDDGITWLQTKRHLLLASLRFHTAVHNALPLTEFVILLQDTIRSIASALNSHLASVGRILAEKILSVARASFPIDGLPGLYQFTARNWQIKQFIGQYEVQGF